MTEACKVGAAGAKRSKDGSSGVARLPALLLFVADALRDNSQREGGRGCLKRKCLIQKDRKGEVTRHDRRSSRLLFPSFFFLLLETEGKSYAEQKLPRITC